MTVKAPFIITPRLLPGLQVGGAFISLDWSGRPGSDAGRVRLRWYIDLADGQEFHDDDLQSGACSFSWQSMFGALLDFLSAAGEGYRFRMSTGRESENEHLFPVAVVEWAYQYSDELSLLAWEIEETPDLLTA